MKRKLIKFIQVKVAIIAILFILLLLVLQTPPIKNIIIKKISTELGEITESKVKIKKQGGFLPFTFDLYSISFEHQNETWLEVEHLSISHPLLTLLIWKQKGINLNLNQATLYALPKFSSNEEINTFKWPKIPFASLKINFSGENINIKSEVFNQKIPTDLSVYLSLNFRQYGKIFSFKGNIESNELEKVSLNASLRGSEKLQKIQAALNLKDPNHELAPYYFSNNFPSFETEIKLSGSPDAMLTFLDPKRETKEKFQGSFTFSAFPSSEDNDILSCLLNKNDLQVSSNIHFENDKGLLFDHVDIKGASLLFNGQLSLSRDYQIENSYLEGKVDCLSFTKYWLQPPIEGDFKTYLQFVGDYKNPKIVGEIASEKIGYKQFIAYQLLSQFEYEYKNIEHLGKVNLKANLNQSPLNISTFYQYKNSNELDLNELIFEYGNNKLDTPSLRMRNQIFQSTVNFDFQNLALISPFFKKEVQGDFKGKAILDIDIKPEGPLQLVQTQISGSFFQAPKVNLSHFSFLINGQLPWKDFLGFQGEIEGSCDFFNYNQFSWDYIQAYINTKNNHTLYKLQAEGECSIFSSGEVGYLNPVWSIDLRQLSGQLHNRPYALLGPSYIEISKKELHFSPFLLKIGSGQLYLAKNSEKNNLNLDLKKFPIESLSFFIPKFDVKGLVNLEGNFENISSETYGKLSVSFDQLSVEEYHNMRPYRGSIQAILDKNFLKGRLLLTQNKKEEINFSFDLPLSLSLYPWEFDLKTDQTAQASLKYNGWVNPFIEMFIPQNHQINGFANVNFSLKGPLRDPQITGFFNLHKGYYENLYLGLVLKDIEAEFLAKKNKILLNRFTANDGLNGLIEANGKVALNFKNHMPYELDVSILNGQIIQFDFLTATFLGNLKFEGDLKQSHLGGNLTVSEADINIPSNMRNSLPILPVTYLYPKEDATCIYAQKLQPPLPIHFDLHLNILDKASINGRGLNSFWTGNLDILGTDQKPKVQGTLLSENGTFEFAGRLFDLKEGVLHFDGDIGKDASIKLIASHQIGEYLVSANLKGPLLSPYLTFNSQPNLKKAKILSLVLFGGEIEDLTPFQAISLANSLATLNGAYTGPDLIDRVRKGIGLDQLSLSSLNSNNREYTTIQVGKYISRGILVTLNRPISASPAPFVVTAYFRGGFQFQTYFDEQQLAKLKIQWSLNY